MNHRLLFFLPTLLSACTSGAPPEEAVSGEAQESSEDSAKRRVPPPSRLRLGLSPYLGAEKTLDRAQPLVRYLSDSIRIPVTAFSAPSYEALVREVAEGKTDLASLSPLSYVKAQEQGARLRILVTPVVTGSPTFLGYIVSRRDGPVREISDLKGRSFAFVGPDSTSGYLYARALLRERGIDPDRDLRESLFVGSHPEVARAILEGRADAGAIGGNLYEDGSVAGLGQLRILGKTSRIPFDAFCIRRTLAEEIALRIERALLTVSSHPRLAARVAAPVGFSGWVRGSDRRYDSVREVLAEERRRAAPKSPR